MTNPTTMTPRTNAAICRRIHTPNVLGFKEHDRVDELVTADFARQLETELNAAREENEKLHVYNDRQLGELMEAVSRARVAESSLATSQENERLLQKACDDLEDTIKQQEASLEKVREETLEEAARVCEEKGKHWQSLNPNIISPVACAAADCADAIRGSK